MEFYFRILFKIHTLTPSILGRISIFILLISCQFYTALEIHVGLKIVETTAIKILTAITTIYGTLMQNTP